MKQNHYVINSLKKTKYLTVKKIIFKPTDIIKINYFYWFEKKLYKKSSIGQVTNLNKKFYHVYFTIIAKIKGVWSKQIFGLHSPFILLIKKLFFY